MIDTHHHLRSREARALLAEHGEHAPAVGDAIRLLLAAGVPYQRVGSAYLWSRDGVLGLLHDLRRSRERAAGGTP